MCLKSSVAYRCAHGAIINVVLYLSICLNFVGFVPLLCHWCSYPQHAAGPGSNSRLPPLAPEPLGFSHKHDATVDIPLDTMNNVCSVLSSNAY